MIWNHLKIAWRTLVKNGLFSFINLFGLSVSIAIFLYLLLFIREEKSFDKFHKNIDDIYRIGLTATFDGQSERWASVPNIVGPTMAREVPEVKAFTRLLEHSFGETAFVRYEDRKFAENKVFWADPGIFEIFDIDLMEGSRDNMLVAPNKILLSESISQKYFDDANPMGKILHLDSYELEVVGVYKDFPKNSTLQPSMLGSFSSVGWAKREYWSNASYETFFLLQPPVDLSELEDKMNAVLDRNVEEEDQWFRFWLQPFSETHLYSADISSLSSDNQGDIAQVRILMALAFGILLIACINYMNLATAQSQKRTKEVGISKVVGASKSTLVLRFYVEAALMVCTATALGIFFLATMMPLFNSMAEKSIGIPDVFEWDLLAGMGGIMLLLTLIAGSYPALALSSMTPQRLFGRGDSNRSGGIILRQILVVGQFAGSILLITSTLVFYKQLLFIQDKNLGFDAEEVVSVSLGGGLDDNQVDGLVNAFESQSFVESVCRAQTYPGADGSGRVLSTIDNPDNGMSIQTNRTAPEIYETLDIELLAGRAHREKVNEEDTTVEVVINEQALAFLGYDPEEAIGKTAYNLFGWDRAKIVGVMRDFHFETVHRPIGAYAFHNNNSEWRRNILVRLRGGEMRKNLEILEQQFNTVFPNMAFQFRFLDDHIDQLYASERRSARIVLFFSITAILIACLGLFGLAAFTAEQRTKELGIRKVLGATVTGLVGLLSKDYLKLVLVSLAIAIPVAWYFLKGWLENYAYHIDLSWWIFALAGLVAMLIALFTVSFQSVRAAIVSPIESLRNE